MPAPRPNDENRARMEALLRAKKNQQSQAGHAPAADKPARQAPPKREFRRRKV